MCRKRSSVHKCLITTRSNSTVPDNGLFTEKCTEYSVVVCIRTQWCLQNF